MDKITRVIFFSPYKFGKRDFNRYGIKIIQQRGYKVEFWEFTYLSNDLYKKHNVPNSISFNGYKKFNKKIKAQLAVDSLTSNDIVIDELCFFEENFYYKILSNNKVRIGIILLGSLPKIISNSHKNKKITIAIRIYKIFISILRHPFLTFNKVLFIIKRNKYILKIIKRKKPIYNFLVTGGNADYQINKYNYKLNINNHTDVIKAHSFDYETYLQNKEYDQNLSNEPFAVFLDEDVPGHPDFDLLGVETQCDRDKYYSEINKFFTDFESKTGLKVIIAIHPRSNLKTRKNDFKGRRMFLNKTIQLVKQSDIVLAHGSTSLNFAVLYNKRIILLSSDYYQKRFKNFIYTQSITLNAKLINISNKKNFELNNNNLDLEKYIIYKDLFIKESGTPNKSIWDIFCDYCDNLS